MTEQSENAWIASEYVKGRTQTEIAQELGYASSAICIRIARFCAALGNPVEHSHYGWHRVEAARQALRRFDGEITRPVKYDDNLTFAYARMEHAWLLRAEGLTLQQIGERLGVGRERARQIVDKFGRRVRKATRNTRFELTRSA